MKRTGGAKTDQILGHDSGPEGLPHSIIVTPEGTEGEAPVLPEAAGAPDAVAIEAPEPKTAKPARGKKAKAVKAKSAKAKGTKAKGAKAAKAAKRAPKPAKAAKRKAKPAKRK
jgi:DNA topoisomerase-6 subunit B